MSYDSSLRRFSITTGTVPDGNVSGVVYPDGKAVYRKYQAASDSMSTEMTSTITDLAAQYSGQTSYALTYVAPTAVDGVSVSPTSGTNAGGTTIVITGTGMNSASVAVTVGGVAATTVRSNATTIACVTGAHAAGAVDIVITTAEGTATMVGAYTYT